MYGNSEKNTYILEFLLQNMKLKKKETSGYMRDC